MDLNALMPVATLVLGAVMSFAASWFTDRAKWRRERSQRWDQLCLSALAEFAAAVKVEARLCVRLASALDLGPVTEPLDPAVGLPKLEEAEDARAEKIEAVRLLADPATVLASQEWQHRVWLLHSYVNGADPRPPGSFNDAYANAGKARDAFYAAARANLAVEGLLETPGPSDHAEAVRLRF